MVVLAENQTRSEVTFLMIRRETKTIDQGVLKSAKRNTSTERQKHEKSASTPSNQPENSRDKFVQNSIRWKILKRIVCSKRSEKGPGQDCL
jgi:hypothetical protein